MITEDDYFGRMSHQYEPDAEVVRNANKLLDRVNAMLDVINETHPGIEGAMNPHVNSGWRPAAYNATVPNAAVKSKHITGQAIDLRDLDGDLDEFLYANQKYLQLAGLYMEHPAATKGWTHLQSEPPRSGNRVFFP